MKNLIKIAMASLLFLSGCESGNFVDKNSEKIMTEKSVPLIVLSNGTKIPQLGLGTYHLAEGKEAYESVLAALKAEYRHIDTAHAYQNERSVGKAIKDSGISRDQIWLTSKLWPNEYGEGNTKLYRGYCLQILEKYHKTEVQKELKKVKKTMNKRC